MSQSRKEHAAEKKEHTAGKKRTPSCTKTVQTPTDVAGCDQMTKKPARKKRAAKKDVVNEDAPKVKMI